ncbi:MAG: hypothetical protein WD036_01870, partial [Bauldia sp.]
MTHRNDTLNIIAPRAVGLAEFAPAYPADHAAQLSAVARAAAAGLSRRPISPVLLAGLARMIELSLMLASGAALYLWLLAPEAGIDWRYAAPLVGASLVAALLIQAGRGYALSAFRASSLQLARVLIAWSIALTPFAAGCLIAGIGGDYSTAWFGAWFLAAGVLLSAFRLWLSATVHDWTRAGRLQRRAVIVGG